MSRGLSTINSAETGERVVRPVLLCELALNDPIRVHTGIGPLTWGGNTWLGVGAFGGVSPIEEGITVSAQELTVSLNGIPSDLLGDVLAVAYRNKRAKLWIGFVDEAGDFKDAPHQFFGGRISTMAIADAGGTCTITVSIESRLADLRRARVSRYTHEEQQQRHPGDNGLAFVARLASAPIYWGIGKNSAATSSSSSPAFPSSIPMFR